VRHLSNLGLGTKKLLNFTPSTPQKRADVRNHKKDTMDLDSTGQGLSTDMFNLFIAPIFAEIRFFCKADHTGSHFGIGLAIDTSSWIQFMTVERGKRVGQDYNAQYTSWRQCGSLCKVFSLVHERS